MIPLHPEDADYERILLSSSSCVTRMILLASDHPPVLLLMLMRLMLMTEHDAQSYHDISMRMIPVVVINEWPLLSGYS